MREYGRPSRVYPAEAGWINPALLKRLQQLIDRGIMPKTSSAPLPEPHERILAITAGFWRSRALAVAAELKLAELLAAGPLHIDVVASRTKFTLPVCFVCYRHLKPWACFHKSHPSSSPIPLPALVFAKMLLQQLWSLQCRDERSYDSNNREDD